MYPYNLTSVESPEKMHERPRALILSLGPQSLNATLNTMKRNKIINILPVVVHDEYVHAH